MTKRRHKLDRLRTAITSMEVNAKSTDPLINWQIEWGIILSAAKCFACEECGGTGKVHFATADVDLECRTCKGPRAIVEGRKVTE